MKNNILLLHGALGSLAQFKELKRILSEDFRVFVMNFAGHGGLPSENEFSIDLFTQNALAFIRENKIEGTDIFGYSMGGYVALNLVSKYPETVGKIITLGTKFDWTPAFTAGEVRMLNPDKIEEKVPRFATALETVHQPEDWKEVVQKTAAMMTELGNGKGLGKNVFSNINIPVLILVGGRDHMVTIEESQIVGLMLPDGEVKVVEDFPHLIEKVDMDELATMIMDFII